MRQAKAMSSKTKTKSRQDLLDEQMQQTGAAVDLQELVDDLWLQKAELDHICNEIIEQQLTQEDFDNVAAESALRNCKWLRTKQKIGLHHRSNHKKFISSDTSSEANYGTRLLFQEPDVNIHTEWDAKRQFKTQVKTLRAGMRCFVPMTVIVYRQKAVIVTFKKREQV